MTYQATLQAGGGLHDHQVHLPGLQCRGQLAPACGIVVPSLLVLAAAHIQVLLGYVDASVGTFDAVRYPAL